MNGNDMPEGIYEAELVDSTQIEHPDSTTLAAQRDTQAMDLKAEIVQGRMNFIQLLRAHQPEHLPYILDAAKMNASLTTKHEYEDVAVMNLIHTPGYGLFSRETMPTYEFVAYLGANHGHHVLIYRTRTDVSDVQYPVQYYAATLTDDGFLMSEKLIASMTSPLHITTATIYADGRIVSQKTNQIWQYAPEDAGYVNNKVIRSEVTATVSYRITGTGRISGS
jgi:hypothetical protein